MELKFVNPEKVAKLPKPAAHGAIVGPGRLIAVAGQIATNIHGEVVGVGDIKAQTRQVLENMSTILKEVGASLDNVFKVTIFLTDIGQIGDVLEVRREYFKNSTPAATAVEIKALVRKELLVEIEALAMIDL